MSQSSIRHSPEQLLASVQHNSWLGAHEQDNIREALETDGASMELYEHYRAKIEHRRLSWERSQ